MRAGLSIIWLLPVLLSGCCTGLLIDETTSAYRHDTVRRIEKAAVIPDNRLVMLVEGTTAESSRLKKFTIEISLNTNGWVARVPAVGMMPGWNTNPFVVPGAQPVAVAPPLVLPHGESPKQDRERLLESTENGRILCLVQHPKPDYERRLYYVAKDADPRVVEIVFDGRSVKTPARYPLLIFVPVTLCADVAFLPFEIYFFSTFGGARTPLPAEKMDKSPANSK
jgi:hypothetical protein